MVWARDEYESTTANTILHGELDGIILQWILVPHAPLRAPGDEKSPSASVTGDLADSVSSDTHLCEVVLKCRPYSTMSSSASRSVFSSFLAPSKCRYVWVFLSRLQPLDVASHFPCPRCNNVLESLRACPPHHLFICRMIKP